MKLILSLLLVVLSFQASAQVKSFDDYLALKKTNVSHERHLPYLLYHGKKTEKVVLLIHGIYSSPLFFRGMAHAYFEKGYNVVTILLPGHWEKDLYSMNKTQEAEWIKEADLGWELARELGDKVILSGHSLGGLLSIDQALKRPASLVEALVIIAPAVDMRDSVVLACRTGKVLRLDGNTFTLSKPNGITIPHFNPRAGLLINSLSKKVLTKKVTTPMYMAYTWLDPVLDPFGLKKFYQRTPSKIKKVRSYGLLSGVTHDNISQGGDDLLTYPTKRPNKEFQIMMNEALEFLSELE